MSNQKKISKKICWKGHKTQKSVLKLVKSEVGREIQTKFDIRDNVGMTLSKKSARFKNSESNNDTLIRRLSELQILINGQNSVHCPKWPDFRQKVGADVTPRLFTPLYKHQAFGNQLGCQWTIQNRFLSSNKGPSGVCRGTQMTLFGANRYQKNWPPLRTIGKISLHSEELEI